MEVNIHISRHFTALLLKTNRKSTSFQIWKKHPFSQTET